MVVQIFYLVNKSSLINTMFYYSFASRSSSFVVVIIFHCQSKTLQVPSCGACLACEHSRMTLSETYVITVLLVRRGENAHVSCPGVQNGLVNLMIIVANLEKENVVSLKNLIKFYLAVVLEAYHGQDVRKIIPSLYVAVLLLLLMTI